MAHCLVIDANFAGIRLLGRLLKRGHRITFLRCDDDFFHTDEQARYILAALDRIADTGGSRDPREIARIVEGIHERDPVEAIFCVFERSIEAAALAAASIGVPFAPIEAVHVARHKNETRAALERAGLATARCRAVGSLEAMLEQASTTPRPFVIKPISGVFSSLVRVVDLQDDLASIADDLRSEWLGLPASLRGYIDRGFMIEDYLSGTLVSVEIGRRRDEYYEFMISGRIQAAANEAIELGSFLPADVSVLERQSCFAYARRVLEAIGLDLGIFHLEMMVTPAGPVLVEANARLMGGMLPFLYDSLSGKFIHDMLIDLVLGNPVAVPEIDPARSVSSFALKTVEGGVVAPDFSTALPAPLSDALTRCDCYVVPGQAITAPMVLARLQAAADDGRRAETIVVEIARHVAGSIGVETLDAAPVTRSALPYLSAPAAMHQGELRHLA